jgi:serine/threonine-protein kinase
MPPEQVRGQRGDPRTDIYALGCLLYELLVGVVPYPAESTHAGARTDPPLVRRLRPEVPAALEAILYRAVRRRPQERYQSMRELAHDLAQLEAVQVPASYEPDEPAPAPLGDLPPLRMLWPVLAGLLAVLLLVGVLAQFAHHAAPK